MHARGREGQRARAGGQKQGPFELLTNSTMSILSNRNLAKVQRFRVQTMEVGNLVESKLACCQIRRILHSSRVVDSILVWYVCSLKFYPELPNSVHFAFIQSCGLHSCLRWHPVARARSSSTATAACRYLLVASICRAVACRTT
uniref:Uncharacterized protein n=1 Tax=Setaria italica TaxID=4555 RepID=K3XZQ6_SETIT